MTNSTFSGNSTSGFPVGLGGAIYNTDTGTLTITSSTFSANSADGEGGTILNEGRTTVTNSIVSGNHNAGIVNIGTLTVTDSTFSGNRGSSGGAIYSGVELTVTNSTFTANRANQGGAIYSGDSGPLTVTNSTFSGNSATAGGGAIYSNSNTVTVTNSIVANSPSGGNCLGTITDGGHNLEDRATCGFRAVNGSLSDTNPRLDPAELQNNGGPTQTVALCTGVGVPAGCTGASPAINAGDQAVCAAAPVNNRDQRDFVRPGTGHTNCSIGAYEADVSPPQACTGDCDGTGTVAVNDLITLASIALGNANVSACPHGIPSGTAVDISLIIQAVNNALSGCGG